MSPELKTVLLLCFIFLTIFFIFTTWMYRKSYKENQEFEEESKRYFRMFCDEHHKYLVLHQTHTTQRTRLAELRKKLFDIGEHFKKP